MLTAAVAVLACGWSSGALADCVEDPATPFVNCNPGTAVVVTNSRTQSLTFAPATATTVNATLTTTELLARLNGGMPLYDQIFNAAFNSPAVQAGVLQARAAITAAGGPGVIIGAPFLVSTTTNTSTNTVTTYALDPAAPTQNQTTTTTLGPATINAAAINNSVIGNPTYNGNPANPNAGFYSLCSNNVLPSTTKPTCTTINGGTFTILAGQEDININTDTNFLIDSATVTTNTTTTNSVYEIDGTVEGFGTVHSAVAEQGFDQADRFANRLLGAGQQSGVPAFGGDTKWTAWAEVYGYTAVTGHQADFPGDTSKAGGLHGGLAYNVDDAFQVGGALDYGAGSIDERSAGEHGNVQLTQAGLYAGWRTGDWFATLAGTYGWATAATTVLPPGTSDTAASSYGFNVSNVSATAGTEFVLGEMTLTPSLGASYTHLHTDSFTEQGSALDLMAGSDGFDRYKGWIGVQAAIPLGAFYVEAYGRAVALGGDRGVDVPVTFAGSSTLLTIDGPRQGSFGGDLGAAFAYAIAPTIDLTASYDAQLRDRYAAQTASFGLRIGF